MPHITTVCKCTYQADRTSSCEAYSLAQAQSNCTAVLDQFSCHNIWSVFVSLFSCRRHCPLFAFIERCTGLPHSSQMRLLCFRIAQGAPGFIGPLILSQWTAPCNLTIKGAFPRLRSPGCVPTLPNAPTPCPSVRATLTTRTGLQSNCHYSGFFLFRAVYFPAASRLCHSACTEQFRTSERVELMHWLSLPDPSSPRTCTCEACP